MNQSHIQHSLYQCMKTIKSLSKHLMAMFPSLHLLDDERQYCDNGTIYSPACAYKHPCHCIQTCNRQDQCTNFLSESSSSTLLKYNDTECYSEVTNVESADDFLEIHNNYYNCHRHANMIPKCQVHTSNIIPINDNTLPITCASKFTQTEMAYFEEREIVNVKVDNIEEINKAEKPSFIEIQKPSITEKDSGVKNLNIERTEIVIPSPTESSNLLYAELQNEKIVKYDDYDQDTISIAIQCSEPLLFSNRKSDNADKDKEEENLEIKNEDKINDNTLSEHGNIELDKLNFNDVKNQKDESEIKETKRLKGDSFLSKNSDKNVKKSVEGKSVNLIETTGTFSDIQISFDLNDDMVNKNKIGNNEDTVLKSGIDMEVNSQLQESVKSKENDSFKLILLDPLENQKLDFESMKSDKLLVPKKDEDHLEKKADIDSVSKNISFLVSEEIILITDRDKIEKVTPILMVQVGSDSSISDDLFHCLNKSPIKPTFEIEDHIIFNADDQAGETSNSIGKQNSNENVENVNKIEKIIVSHLSKLNKLRNHFILLPKTFCDHSAINKVKLISKSLKSSNIYHVQGTNEGDTSKRETSNDKTSDKTSDYDFYFLQNNKTPIRFRTEKMPVDSDKRSFHQCEMVVDVESVDIQWDGNNVDEIQSLIRHEACPNDLIFAPTNIDTLNHRNEKIEIRKSVRCTNVISMLDQSIQVEENCSFQNFGMNKDSEIKNIKKDNGMISPNAISWKNRPSTGIFKRFSSDEGTNNQSISKLSPNGIESTGKQIYSLKKSVNNFILEGRKEETITKNFYVPSENINSVKMSKPELTEIFPSIHIYVQAYFISSTIISNIWTSKLLDTGAKLDFGCHLSWFSAWEHPNNLKEKILALTFNIEEDKVDKNFSVIKKVVESYLSVNIHDSVIINHNSNFISWGKKGRQNHKVASMIITDCNLHKPSMAIYVYQHDNNRIKTKNFVHYLCDQDFIMSFRDIEVLTEHDDLIDQRLRYQMNSLENDIYFSDEKLFPIDPITVGNEGNRGNSENSNKESSFKLLRRSKDNATKSANNISNYCNEIPFCSDERLRTKHGNVIFKCRNTPLGIIKNYMSNTKEENITIRSNNNHLCNKLSNSENKLMTSNDHTLTIELKQFNEKPMRQLNFSKSSWLPKVQETPGDHESSANIAKHSSIGIRNKEINSGNIIPSEYQDLVIQNYTTHRKFNKLVSTSSEGGHARRSSLSNSLILQQDDIDCNKSCIKEFFEKPSLRDIKDNNSNICLKKLSSKRYNEEIKRSHKPFISRDYFKNKVQQYSKNETQFDVDQKNHISYGITKCFHKVKDTDNTFGIEESNLCRNEKLLNFNILQPKSKNNINLLNSEIYLKNKDISSKSKKDRDRRLRSQLKQLLSTNDELQHTKSKSSDYIFTVPKYKNFSKVQQIRDQIYDNKLNSSVNLTRHVVNQDSKMLPTDLKNISVELGSEINSEEVTISEDNEEQNGFSYLSGDVLSIVNEDLNKINNQGLNIRSSETSTDQTWYQPHNQKSIDEITFRSNIKSRNILHGPPISERDVDDYKQAIVKHDFESLVENFQQSNKDEKNAMKNIPSKFLALEIDDISLFSTYTKKRDDGFHNSLDSLIYTYQHNDKGVTEDVTKIVEYPTKNSKSAAYSNNLSTNAGNRSIKSEGAKGSVLLFGCKSDRIYEDLITNKNDATENNKKPFDEVEMLRSSSIIDVDKSMNISNREEDFLSRSLVNNHTTNVNTSNHPVTFLCVNQELKAHKNADNPDQYLPVNPNSQLVKVANNFGTKIKTVNSWYGSSSGSNATEQRKMQPGMMVQRSESAVSNIPKIPCQKADTAPQINKIVAFVSSTIENKTNQHNSLNRDSDDFCMDVSITYSESNITFNESMKQTSLILEASGE